MAARISALLWGSLASCVPIGNRHVRRLSIAAQDAILMPLVFPKTANPAQTVGRTPWSARDALVPRLKQLGQHHAKRAQADGGVGRGPGGPPHNQCRRCDTGENEWHWVANLPHKPAPSTAVLSDPQKSSPHYPHSTP